MLYDLKKPCKNCPFRTDETRITFANEKRAEEIAETAYRNGFPCHLSAEVREYKDPECGETEEGYFETSGTQHCAGALIMFMKDGHTEWPGVDNDDELVERLWDQLDMKSPVFESEEDFIEANS